MDDHGQDPNGPSGLNPETSSEQVRTRWNPKPEQISILDTIFNSGMVNPPKDETVRIRKLLEKFGPVGDANIFYWFQNRRSRSRRRLRQMEEANALAVGGDPTNNNSDCQNHRSQVVGSSIHSSGQSSSTTCSMGYEPMYDYNSPQCPPTSYHAGLSSADHFGAIAGQEPSAEKFFPFPGQVGFPEMDRNLSISSVFCPSETSSLPQPYHSGYITVFINGIPTEVPTGPIEMEAVFGQNAVLVHSSGVPLPINEFGFLMQSLEHGGSYFLVSRPT